jgi:hypothetical protein
MSPNASVQIAPSGDTKKSSKRDSASITMPNYYSRASLIFSGRFTKYGIRVVAGEISLPLFSPTDGVHHGGLWWSRNSTNILRRLCPPETSPLSMNLSVIMNRRNNRFVIEIDASLQLRLWRARDVDIRSTT